jgi:integrase
MTMPHTATEKQLELALPLVIKAASRSILPPRVVRKERLFEGLKHVRRLTRSGKIEYQYDREINPKPLRPIAQKLFGRWSHQRALHTEADYHTAALEYDEMIRRCRSLTETEIVMHYQGPIADPWLSQAMIAVNSMHIPGGRVPTLFLRGEHRPRVAGTPFSTKQAIAKWVEQRARISKGQAIRAKQSVMYHFYGWMKRQGRITLPFVDPPKGYKSRGGGEVDGKIADLSNDDLIQITSDDLRDYRDHLVKKGGNNYAIDHMSSIGVLLTTAYAEVRPGEKNPADAITLPGKRPKGERRQFADDEVRRIFDALPGTAPCIYWPVMVMSHLGLINEEVSDAATHDVERVGDMVVLRVQDKNRKLDDGQKNELKQKQRERHLPLPPVIAEDFWGYVEGVRAEHGAGPLFPMITPDRDGLRSPKIGRKVRDFIQGVGIKATPYSFRHRFATYLNDIGERMTDDTRRYMTGHKPRDVLAATYLHHHPEKLKPFIDGFNPLGRSGLPR